MLYNESKHNVLALIKARPKKRTDTIKLKSHIKFEMNQNQKNPSKPRKWTTLLLQTNISSGAKATCKQN
jgi:hypothetical protein